MDVGQGGIQRLRAPAGRPPRARQTCEQKSHSAGCDSTILPASAGVLWIAPHAPGQGTGPGSGGPGTGFPLPPITGQVVDVIGAAIIVLIVVFLVVLVVLEVRSRASRGGRPGPVVTAPPDEIDQYRMDGDRAYRWPKEQVGEPDPLGIGEFVEIIGKQILQAHATSFTLAIDAEWGMGKSSTMWLLRQWLEQHGCLTIWFNAWKYRRDDIQRAFMSTIITGFPPKTWNRFFSRSSERLDLIKQSGNLIGQAARIGQVGTLIAAAFGDDATYRNQLEADFQEVISTWAEQQPGGRPIAVIFVDDLDRCQPTEIARVLEMMKLFFETPGCIFVFGYDSGIVASSIENANRGIADRERRYDGQSYLKKLIQYTFRLQRPSPAALREFLDVNIEVRRLGPLFEHLQGQPDYHELIMRGTEGNLRDIKRFLDAVAVSAQVIRRQLRDDRTYYALCLLMMLQVRWPKCHVALEEATRLQEQRAFIAEISWYLELRAKRRDEATRQIFWQGDIVGHAAGMPAGRDGDIAFSEHTREREAEIAARMPWLVNNVALQAFLERYTLRGLEDEIQRLIMNGLPQVHGGALLDDIEEDEEGAAGARRAPGGGGAIPRQVQPLVGRAEELDALVDRLRTGGRGAVVTVFGLGGIGKTALAAAAAESLRAEGRYRDGIAWVVGAGRVDPAAVLGDALVQLAPPQDVPQESNIEALAALTKQLLADKDVLVIIDSVEPPLVEQVTAPLKEAGATVLLTARQALPGSDGGFEVTGLQELPALKLFCERLGRPEAELRTDQREAARRVVTALRRIPLLIELTAAYLRQTHHPLDEMARQIEREQHANGEDPSGRLLAAQVMRRSVEQLPAGGQRMFAALGIFASPEFGWHAAIALGAGLGIQGPEAVLGQIVDAGLVQRLTRDDLPEMSDRDRLRLYPLLREYAVGMFEHEPGQGREREREGAYKALTAYYARYCASMAALGPDALDADAANLTMALKWAAQREEDEQVAGIAVGLGVLWNARGATNDSLRWLPPAIEAAERVAQRSNHRDDKLRVADLALAHAQALRRDGQIERARDAIEGNLPIRHALNDRRGEGRVLAQRGLMARLVGDMELAADSFEQSLKIRQEEGDLGGEAYDLSQLGQMAKGRGRLEEAQQYFTRSLELRRKAGDRAGEADDLGYLGEVARLRGDTDVAAGYYQQSLEKARAVSYPRAEATALSHLGQLERVRGDLDRAQQHLEASLAIRREMRDKRREGFDLGLLGRIEQARGRLDHAEQLFQQSLEIARSVQDKRGIAAVLSSLAQLDLARGNLAEAEQHLSACLPLHREIQDAQGESIALSQLGRLFLDRGDFEQAAQYFQQSLEIERASKDLPGIGVDLSQLALVAVEAGRLDEAARYLDESLPIRQQVRDTRGEGVDLALRGRIAFERGQWQEADGFYQQSLALARQVQNRRGSGVNIRYRGLIAEQRGELEQAEQELRDSLEIGEEVRNGLDIADAKREIGRFLIERRGQRDAGCILLTEAVASYQEIGARRQEQHARELAQRLGCAV